MVITKYHLKDKSLEDIFDMIVLCIVQTYRQYDQDESNVKITLTDDIKYVSEAKENEYIAYVHTDHDIVDIKYGFDVCVELNKESHRMRFMFGVYTKQININVSWAIPGASYATVYDHGGKIFMVEEFDCWLAAPISTMDKILSYTSMVILIIILVIAFILGLFGGWVIMILIIIYYAWQFHRTSVGLNSYKDAFYKLWLYPFTPFNTCMPYY